MKYKLFLVLFFCYGTMMSQPDTLVYTMVKKGKITGAQKTWRTSAGEWHYAYQYNDRGRGDSVSSTVHVGADSLITALEVSGIDYYKNPYAEQFSFNGDSASWTINGVKKSTIFNHQIYTSDETPFLMDWQIRWILKQPNRKAAILPGGFMHADEVMPVSVTLNGKTKQLKLVCFYFDPSPLPNYVWMTTDLRFFASVASWGSTVSKGYEAWTDSLFALQESAAQGYYSNEVKNNSAEFPPRMLLVHANIFSSANATVKQNMTVEVVNGKITGLYPSSPETNNIKADTVIDCKGKMLLPGLWDMHGHYAKQSGAFYLAGGVTHIRDMGNEKILLTYKKQIALNTLMGPDISYESGFIDKEDLFQGPTGIIIKTLDEGIKAIDTYHQLGYEQIKLYSAIKAAWVAPMAAHAHRLGMKVCGHVPAFMTAEQAINAGYDEITHLNFIMLNFMGDTIDTRTPARFRLVGTNAGKLDLQSQQVKDFIGLMKRKHISLDATMNVWQGMFDEFKGDTSSYLKPIVSWLPESWLSSISVQSPFGSEENRNAYKASFQNMLQMLKLLYDNGILLVPGTDGGDANALHHELELYVKAGIPANQVLKIATYNAALDCKLQNKYGSIETGRDADFILIDGDPVSNISDIRRVNLVIKNDRMYRPKQLLAAQGWKYYE